MKAILFDIARKVIKGAATVSSETTSMFGLYQPPNPKTLIKSGKKRKK